MSAFSTTSYYPFDSEAPTVFRTYWMNNYLNVAFLTLLLFDHAITLDKEVEWIWTFAPMEIAKNSVLFQSLCYQSVDIVAFHTVLFLPFHIREYSLDHGISDLFINPPYHFSSMSYMSLQFAMWKPYALTSSCNFDDNYLSFIPVLGFCVAELLLATRVCSLCKLLITNELLRAKSTTITDDNGKVVTPTEIAAGFIDYFLLLPLKFVVWSLRGLVASGVIGGTVAEALYVRQWYGSYQVAGYTLHLRILLADGLCGAPDSRFVDLVINQYFRAAFLSVEGVLMLLTVYKLFSYRNRMNQTVAMLARDSIVYFIVIFACLILDILSDVDDNIIIGVTTPTQCITSIAVARMMMNIRGLIMNDLEHTVHLQTLRFATWTNADSEIQERTRGDA
ncbi:hypothetical protein PILCRDRAFT_14197 [Piloderma croceum F 1598]|uniref:DUF6533 domain-containing protein n=1 Tax=Piloderma croceum (strain F 1598) TaxID=765440 RepID=A0A0C3F3Z3_PILCF|nr:hypothetical protein PILCRDRAFT_14197 [Piloderma croceum F 1598]